jgi:hypothetical protein
MAFPGSKHIIDVINAQLEGEKSQLDLRAALQRGQAEQQFAALEARQKEAEKQQKLQEQQAQQRAKQQGQGRAQGPDLVPINPSNAVQSLSRPPSDFGALDAGQASPLGLASGGAGAQTQLAQLQSQRAQSQQPPTGGLGTGGASIGQRTGQAQGFNVPDRLNSFGLQSTTGNTPLGQRLGDPVNTLNFQSRPNALTPFQAGSLQQAARRTDIQAAQTRAQMFTEFFTKIPKMTAAKAQAGVQAFFDDDPAALTAAFQGSEHLIWEMYELNLDKVSLEMDHLNSQINLNNMKALAETGALGSGGTMTIPQILEMPGQSTEPLDDTQLLDQTNKLLVKDRLSGVTTGKLQPAAIASAPLIQAAWLARRQAVFFEPAEGAMLASLGFASEAGKGFGNRPVTDFLGALDDINDASVKPARRDAAHKLLQIYYVQDPKNANRVAADENGQPFSKQDVNKPVGDALLILSDQMAAVKRQLGIDELTLSQYMQFVTLMKLQQRAAQVGISGGQVGPTP